ncbi:MAG: bifunctional DNA-formamidopyrimidine glycosylase/DNA-(apurinic or apyrimidinic site) lyase [Patescibacteria group bacterium]
MPELPEVETIRLQLSSVLVGKTIKSIEVRKAKLWRGDRAWVIGKKIVRLRRYSKLLVIDLTDNFSLAIHLKLTGRLVYEKLKVSWDVDYPTDKHTHIVIAFSDRSKLYFHDLRQFGYIQVVESNTVESLPYVSSLGPEFFRNLDLGTFTKIIKKGTRPVKLVLMDQQRLAGVGNIYANESLWCAKIYPKRRANALSDEQIAGLFHCLEKIFKQAIVWKGASDNDYRDAFGEKGHVQEHFNVYNCEGKPCGRCQTPIKKITLGGRGTYYCSNCQKENPQN